MSKPIVEKRAELLTWLQGGGYDENGAERELMGMVRYQMTGVDAVGYEYAIACIWSDVFEN